VIVKDLYEYAVRFGSSGQEYGGDNKACFFEAGKLPHGGKSLEALIKNRPYRLLLRFLRVDFLKQRYRREEQSVMSRVMEKSSSAVASSDSQGQPKSQDTYTIDVPALLEGYKLILDRDDWPTEEAKFDHLPQEARTVHDTVTHGSFGIRANTPMPNGGTQPVSDRMSDSGAKRGSDEFVGGRAPDLRDGRPLQSERPSKRLKTSQG
jgi:hypothetical protein